jgi:hypothetical protein
MEIEAPSCEEFILLNIEAYIVRKFNEFVTLAKKKKKGKIFDEKW